jgi:hypothetical protein
VNTSKMHSLEFGQRQQQDEAALNKRGSSKDRVKELKDDVVVKETDQDKLAGVVRGTHLHIMEWLAELKKWAEDVQISHDAWLDANFKEVRSDCDESRHAEDAAQNRKAPQQDNNRNMAAKVPMQVMVKRSILKDPKQVRKAKKVRFANKASMRFFHQGIRQNRSTDAFYIPEWDTIQKYTNTILHVVGWQETQEEQSARLAERAKREQPQKEKAAEIHLSHELQEVADFIQRQTKQRMKERCC